MDKFYRILLGSLVFFALGSVANGEATRPQANKTETVKSDRQSESDNKSGTEVSAKNEKKSTEKTSEDKPVFVNGYESIDWVALIPAEDLEALENPPDYLDDIEDGSEEDQLGSSLKSGSHVPEDRYQQALVSKTVRPEYNGRKVRIPGFIVPLQFDDHETITTFFLVPFFGACIHVPPPPPNQIIYAEYEPGMRLEVLYDPFWINGTLSTTLVENDMATAAYSITVSSIEPYTDYVDIPP